MRIYGYELTYGTCFQYDEYHHGKVIDDKTQIIIRWYSKEGPPFENYYQSNIYFDIIKIIDEIELSLSV
jgi:hypothetical protein